MKSFKKSDYRTFALITQLGLSMLTPIFLCIFVGSFLQNKLHIPLFIPLLILGFLAGIRNSYLLIKQTVNDEDEEDQEDE